MTPCSALGSSKGHQTHDGATTACGLTVGLMGLAGARRDRCLRCFPPLTVRRQTAPPPPTRPAQGAPTPKSQRPAAPKPEPSTPEVVKPEPQDPGTVFRSRLAPVWELCDRLDAFHATATQPRPLDPVDVPIRRRWTS